MKKRKNPPKPKLPADNWSPEDSARLEKLMLPVANLLIWFSKVQPENFDKVNERWAKLSDTFQHRLLGRGNELLTASETKQYEKWTEVEKYIVHVMSDFTDYIDVLHEVDKKALVLVNLLAKEKKQDQVLNNFQKLEELYTPVIEHLLKLKDRCNAIPPKLDELELMWRKELN
jgi:hypothetical protein